MKRGLLLLSLLAWQASSYGADWPQWRGPQRNGISTETVSAAWPADGPKLLWRAAVGTGFSSISVSAGRVYTMGNSTNEDTVWCFDAVTGKELWRHTYPSRLDPQWYEGGPGSTPTVSSNRVFTISKWGDVFCLDTAHGKVVWHHDLREDGLKPNRWGFAGSPLLWHGLVILNAGTAGTALDCATGRLIWCNGTNAAGYASPEIFHFGDKELALVFAAKCLVALDPATGHEVWRQSWETDWDTNISDPSVCSEGIFLSSFSRGCGLLSFRDAAPQLVYTNRLLSQHLSPGILLGDYLYSFSGEAKQDTDFRCLHVPSGELKWTRKDPAFGSLICAAGKLLLLSDKGELILADASPAELKPLARAKVLTGKCWTPPALANGRLYARNATGDLRCLELKPGETPR